MNSPNWLAQLPKPEPSLGIETYNLERERALDYDPRRRENYKIFKNARRSADVNYLPVKMDIENVSRCNFRCTMCMVSDWQKQKRANDMSLEDFKALIDAQYGLVEIKIQGMGEPLLQGKVLFDMIQYARQKCIWVRTISNASLFHLRDNYKNLIDSGVNELQISIDGATEDVYSKIRRGGVFKRVIENCKLINAYAKQKNRPVTKMWTVVQKDNFHQLMDFVDLAAECGFQSMVFSLSMTDWGQEEWRETNSGKSILSEFSPELAQALIKKGNEKGVKVAFWIIGDVYDTNDPSHLCPWPFERYFVGSDMRISPCCMIANPDVFEVKQQQSNDFTGIWSGDNYKEFRNSHLQGDIPSVCLGCYGKTAS